MVMHFPDCFYFHVIQGQGIIHDFFESKLRLLIRIRCLCIKSYGLVGKMSCILKLTKSYITSRNSAIKQLDLMYLNHSCNIMPVSYYENISLTDSDSNACK